MIENLPPIGARVTFRDGVRKPKEWNGTVIAHEPPDDEWGAGIRVEWPTMHYHKAKGVTVFHSIPSHYLEVSP